jgi:tetratricopeptide (TPR) repeat protein
MGMTRKAIPHILIGIAGVIAIIFLPDNIGRLVGLALTWGYIAFFRSQMKSDIEKLDRFDVRNAHWFGGFLISAALYGIVLIGIVVFTLLQTAYESITPGHASYYATRGDNNLNSGNYDLAITEYTRAIELEPNSRALYYSRGLAYHQKGDFESAIDDLTFVFTLPENVVITDAMVYYARGQVYEDSDKHELAFIDFTEFIKLQPNDVYGYTNRAVSLESLGQIDKAIQDMEQALKLSDDLSLKQAVENEITRLKGK